MLRSCSALDCASDWNFISIGLMEPVTSCQCRWSKLIEELGIKPSRLYTPSQVPPNLFWSCTLSVKYFCRHIPKCMCFNYFEIIYMYDSIYVECSE